MSERDGLIIEGRPWRSREELEAEVERLKERAEALQDEVIGLLIAEAQRGRPRTTGSVCKRHARRRRAQPPCVVREMLRAAGKRAD
jgi:hypothetical protein